MVTLAGERFSLEIAATEKQATIGLMGRQFMGANEGMVFLFANERLRRFKMENCLFDLDAIFLNSEGYVVDIHHMLALQADQTPYTYISLSPSQFVVELNHGTASRLNLRNGMKLDLPIDSLKKRLR
jgi:uncharacterized membrane protein (UPF0127 family)